MKMRSTITLLSIPELYITFTLSYTYKYRKNVEINRLTKKKKETNEITKKARNNNLKDKMQEAHGP